MSDTKQEIVLGGRTPLPGHIEVIARFANRDMPLGYRTEEQVNMLIAKGKGFFEDGKFIIPMSSTLVDAAQQRDVHEEKNALLDRMEAMRKFTTERDPSLPPRPEGPVTAEDEASFTAEIIDTFGPPAEKPDSLEGVEWDEYSDPEKLKLLKETFGKDCFSDGLPTRRTPAPMPPEYRRLLDEQMQDAVVVLDWSKKGIAASRAQRGLRHAAAQPAPKLLAESVPAMDLDLGRRDKVEMYLDADFEVVDTTPLQQLPREEK